MRSAVRMLLSCGAALLFPLLSFAQANADGTQMEAAKKFCAYLESGSPPSR